MEPTSVSELLVLLGEGARPKYLFFWGHSQKGSHIDASCLSQWFPANFTEKGNTFLTAEHYMMFRKAILFGDDSAAKKALQAKSPGEAKSIGRTVRKFDEHTWIEARYQIVAEANTLKFSQNAQLGNYLLGTGDRVLVEASPVDRIWGIGMTKDEALNASPKNWKGLNLLGFALMAARSKLDSRL